MIEEAIMSPAKTDLPAIAPRDPMACLFLHISVANLSEIEAAFGLQAREQAFERLLLSVRQTIGQERIEAHRSLGIIEVTMRLSRMPRHKRTAMLAEQIRALALATPLTSDKGPFFAIPAITAIAFLPGRSQREIARLKAYDYADQQRPLVWAKAEAVGYRADMKEAANLLGRLANGRAAFARQAIAATGHGLPPLYHESLLRISDDDGAFEGCEMGIRAVERLDLSFEMDGRLAAIAVEQLERDPALRLGVNISARSSSFHRFGRHTMWGRLRDSLKDRPEVARRLTLEITETADFASLEEAREFVAGWRQLGVRIALDDFGTGWRSIEQAVHLAVDIVKIDGNFVRHAADAGSAFATFLHLVRLGSSLAATVIVEGIETARQADMARQAGAQGLQGYHVAHPVLGPCLPGTLQTANILHLDLFRALQSNGTDIAAKRAERLSTMCEWDSHARD